MTEWLLPRRYQLVWKLLHTDGARQADCHHSGFEQYVKRDACLLKIRYEPTN